MIDTKINVALVAMPFLSCARPCLQIGLLKSIAERSGFRASTMHLNLDFAAMIGVPQYEVLCRHRGRMFGDWLFAEAAFDTEVPSADSFVEMFQDEVISLETALGVPPGWLIDVRRNIVLAFVERLIGAIEFGAYNVVGFSSTFQQNAASFALARRIKNRWPSVITIFGGSNFEGEMGRELTSKIKAIDYAVIGEGDVAFPNFLTALQQGVDPTTIPGVVKGGPQPKHFQPSLPFHKLDDLPTPNYEEFFVRSETLNVAKPAVRRKVDLPFESSRGCWWGAKKHCTFCGLNGQTLTYRSKSPQRMAAELEELSASYRSFQFEAVDNILDMGYLETLLPSLVASNRQYEFFYEIKSNMNRSRIRLLTEAGVKRVQPGIESLHSGILKLMDKGVTAAQNVNLLRWAMYYGVRVSWNILWGFPGEHEDQYREQAALMRHLTHLEPPTAAGRIWMERFSPIYFDRQRFPVRKLLPEASYQFVYPTYVDLKRVAYFFDYEFEESLPNDCYEETALVISKWQQEWKTKTTPSLTYWYSPSLMLIEDTRCEASTGSYVYREPISEIYHYFCEGPASISGLQRTYPDRWPLEEVQEVVDELCRVGLMMRDGNAYLSLAIPGR